MRVYKTRIGEGKIIPRMRYIDLEGKAFERENQIKRYFHLVDLLYPGRFLLNTIHLDAAIECRERCLSVVHFNGNLIWERGTYYSSLEVES